MMLEIKKCEVTQCPNPIERGLYCDAHRSQASRGTQKNECYMCHTTQELSIKRRDKHSTLYICKTCRNANRVHYRIRTCALDTCKRKSSLLYCKEHRNLARVHAYDMEPSKYPNQWNDLAKKTLLRISRRSR